MGELYWNILDAAKEKGNNAAALAQLLYITMETPDMDALPCMGKAAADCLRTYAEGILADLDAMEAARQEERERAAAAITHGA